MDIYILNNKGFRSFANIKISGTDTYKSKIFLGKSWQFSSETEKKCSL